MKKSNMIIIIFMVITLIPSLALASTNDFSDTNTHWANEYIKNLVQDSIISGYPDGNFYPDNQIKVSEFTKLIINSIGQVVDSADSGEWYIPYVNKAKELDIVIEGEFDTYDRNITRAEMCRMVVRASKQGVSDGDTNFDDDDEIAEEFKAYVKKAVELSIVNGYPDNTFKPNNTVTRGEASKIISVSREQLGGKTKDAKQGKTEGDKGTLSEEKIQEIINRLDEMVASGELTTEERDILVEEIGNGELENAKAIMKK